MKQNKTEKQILKLVTRWRPFCHARQRRTILSQVDGPVVFPKNHSLRDRSTAITKTNQTSSALDPVPRWSFPVQFQIHAAAKLEQKKDRQYHWSMTKIAKLSDASFVFWREKFSKITWSHFNFWIGKLFLCKIFKFCVITLLTCDKKQFNNGRGAITINVRLMFSWATTTTRYLDFKIRSVLRGHFSIHEVFNVAGEFSTSFDVVNFSMF